MSATEASCAELVKESCEYVRRVCTLEPRVAIILGSGLGRLADEIDSPVKIPYVDIPSFPRASATGHKGNLVFGSLNGVPVVIMQGRAHRYEGYGAAEVSYPIRCLRQLGARTLLVTNAAGGLNPRFQQGDIMVIDQHLHWLWNRRQVVPCSFDEDQATLTDCVSRSASPYCESLIDLAIESALQHRKRLQRGTYISTLGPTYETRAEYRMFRTMGADAVGMSTTTEVLAAQELKMPVLGLSVITNVASTDIPSGTTHAEVIDMGLQIEPILKRILSGVVARLEF